MATMSMLLDDGNMKITIIKNHIQSAISKTLSGRAQISEFHCIKPRFITKTHSLQIGANSEKESEVNTDFDVGASTNIYKTGEMVAARLTGKRKNTALVYFTEKINLDYLSQSSNLYQWPTSKDIPWQLKMISFKG